MGLHQMKKRFWVLVGMVILSGLIIVGCGNEPTPPQVAAVSTETPFPPSPTPTNTPEPTATLIPSPTPALTDTPAPTPTATATATPDAPPNVTAVEGNVNLRLGPGTTFESVGLLEAGNSLEIIGRNEDSSWFQVATEDGPRWISAEVTEAENLSDDIPVAEPDESVAVQPTAPPPPTATPENAEETEPTPTPEIVTCSTLTVTSPTGGEVINTPDIEVRWRCDGELPPDHGFEVKLWLPGETPLGAHDAINDVPNIVRDGEEYGLTVPIKGAAGFKDVNQEYAIAVSLVKVSPEYEDTGVMSEEVLFRYE